MGSVIKFLIGISIFIILVGCGFTLAAQIYMWVGVFALLLVSIISFGNIQYNLNRLKNNLKITEEFNKILPYITQLDFDVKSAHSFCGNLLSAMIVFYMIPTVVLPIAILATMLIKVVTLQKTKEFIKRVNNDTSHQ